MVDHRNEWRGVVRGTPTECNACRSNGWAQRPRLGFRVDFGRAFDNSRAAMPSRHPHRKAESVQHTDKTNAKNMQAIQQREEDAQEEKHVPAEQATTIHNSVALLPLTSAVMASEESLCTKTRLSGGSE